MRSTLAYFPSQEWLRAWLTGHTGPDTVASELKHLAEAGFDGFCFSLVAYNDELPYFLQEVLPRLERLGLRQPPR